jgi:membrane protein DedA with SNARE-associated domain
MAYRGFERSIPEAVADLMSQFPLLLRKEAELARTEVSEKIGQVGNGIAMIAIGAVLLIPALVILLMAGVEALIQAGFEPPIASLIAGGAALLVGVIIMFIGTRRLKAENLMPNRTIQQFEQDASAVKRQVRLANEERRAA